MVRSAPAGAPIELINKGHSGDLDDSDGPARISEGSFTLFILIPPQVKGIIWDDFIPFNWESRKKGRGWKNWAKPLNECWQLPSPCLGECTSLLVWKGSQLQICHYKATSQDSNLKKKT